jgi:hypothetical protein
MKNKTLYIIIIAFLAGYLAAMALIGVTVKEIGQTQKNQGDRLAEIEYYLDRIGVIK